MAGKESEDYRPRRALPPDDSDDSNQPFTDDTASHSPVSPDDDSGAWSDQGDGDTAPNYSGYSYPSDHDAEEQPKPLYRDEVSETDQQPQDQTAVSRPMAASTPRFDTGPDPDDDVIDDLGDIDEDGPRLGQRGRLALLIGAVAAVVVLGLAIGYAVVGRPNGPSAAPPDASPSPAASGSTTSGAPEKPSGELLTSQMLINAGDAKPIDEERDWKVSRTVTKVDSTSPQAICLGVAIDGLPTPREAMMQLLESSGKGGPAILHQATAYGSAEEAAQAYALIAKAVGSCTVEGTSAWIHSGRTVTGLGDQSLGVVVKVLNGENEEYRSLVLSRSGRVLNVVDVAKQKKAVPVGDAVPTAAAAINRQCTVAEGKCAKKTADKAGPPPVGDQPGYLSGGDLPAPSKDAGAWFADDPENLVEVQHGSGCETADLSKVAGGRAVSRTFLVDGDAGDFGLDQYVVTMKSESDAKKLAEKFRDDWEDCEERKVTPKVEDPEKIKGTGAKDAKITGWVTEVEVPTNDSESRTYRVGIAWVGKKVISTFLSPTDKLDLEKADWEQVTIRAAERATQVK